MKETRYKMIWPADKHICLYEESELTPSMVKMLEEDETKRAIYKGILDGESLSKIAKSLGKSATSVRDKVQPIAQEMEYWYKVDYARANAPDSIFALGMPYIAYRRMRRAEDIDSMTTDIKTFIENIENGTFTYLGTSCRNMGKVIFDMIIKSITDSGYEVNVPKSDTRGCHFNYGWMTDESQKNILDKVFATVQECKDETDEDVIRSKIHNCLCLITKEEGYRYEVGRVRENSNS